MAAIGGECLVTAFITPRGVARERGIEPDAIAYRPRQGATPNG
jgi:hypothetical protein